MNMVRPSKGQAVVSIQYKFKESPTPCLHVYRFDRLVQLYLFFHSSPPILPPVTFLFLAACPPVSWNEFHSGSCIQIQFTHCSGRRPKNRCIYKAVIALDVEVHCECRWRAGQRPKGSKGDREGTDVLERTLLLIVGYGE